jgi:hypothetical protein
VHEGVEREEGMGAPIIMVLSGGRGGRAHRGRWMDGWLWQRWGGGADMTFGERVRLFAPLWRARSGVFVCVNTGAWRSFSYAVPWEVSDAVPWEMLNGYT